MFLEGYETFISAILASQVKIRVLNYDADLEIFNSVPQYPHFDHFFDFFWKSNQNIFQTGRIKKTPRIWTYWNEFWAQWNF